jgi:hypothetical protein
MFDYAKGIPKESIIDIKGRITVPKDPVKGCS